LAISSLVILLKVVSRFPLLSSRSFMRPRFRSIAVVRRLGPSLSFCLRGASAPSGSLAQPWPWSIYFYRCSTCTMPLLLGGSSLCGQLPIPSAVHSFLGSEPS
jgi:hypothetical protein